MVHQQNPMLPTVYPLFPTVYGSPRYRKCYPQYMPHGIYTPDIPWGTLLYTVGVYRGEQTRCSPYTVGNNVVPWATMRYRGEHDIPWVTIYTVGNIRISRRQVPWGTLYTVENM